MSEATLTARLGQLAAVKREIASVIVGQNTVVDEVLMSLLARGHCLLQGVPGLGKTRLLQTLARVLDLSFGRIQFTPDLMPGDIIGTELLHQDEQGTRHLEFKHGPVFASLLLADEINRTPPRTQAALLEAMEERTVTFAGTSHALPEPFFVMATQNPLEQAGTYPLPEAQLDRFLMMIEMDYPTLDEERQILALTTQRQTSEVSHQMQAEDILLLQRWVRDIVVSDAMLDYATRLVRATRPGDADAAAVSKQWIRWGAGPRAGQSLLLAAKARALMSGRLAVQQADVHAAAVPVLRHRVILSYAAEAEEVGVVDYLAELIAVVPEPADPLASET
ncbi:MAG: AAA family ATPase [Pseudomonadota bacterium]